MFNFSGAKIQLFIKKEMIFVAIKFLQLQKISSKTKLPMETPPPTSNPDLPFPTPPSINAQKHKPPAVAAIVLAAGLSRRMGKQNKLLLTVGKQTLIEKIVDKVTASNVQEILVVLGHEAAKIHRTLRNKSIKMVKNPLYQLGMTTSIQAGVQATLEETKGYMILLGDLAKIETQDLNLLIATFETQIEKNPQVIVLPIFEEKKGNPVIFSNHYRAAILQHKDMNGCKGIVQAHSDKVIKIEMPDNHVVSDIDTPDDYQAILEEKEKKNDTDFLDSSDFIDEQHFVE